MRLQKHRDEIAAGEEDYSEDDHQPEDPQESTREEERACRSVMLRIKKRRDENSK